PVLSPPGSAPPPPSSPASGSPPGVRKPPVLWPGAAGSSSCFSWLPPPFCESVCVVHIVSLQHRACCPGIPLLHRLSRLPEHVQHLLLLRQVADRIGHIPVHDFVLQLLEIWIIRQADKMRMKF